MTAHPIDTEALRREALGQLGRVAADPRWPGRVLALLDLLAAAEHRAEQAEARIKAVQGVLEQKDADLDAMSNPPREHRGVLMADIRRALTD